MMLYVTEDKSLIVFRLGTTRLAVYNREKLSLTFNVVGRQPTLIKAVMLWLYNNLYHIDKVKPVEASLIVRAMVEGVTE